MSTASPPQEPTFYMTCERRSRLEDIIETDAAPVMVNVMDYCSPDGTLRDFKPYNAPYVLDSGGYSAMDQYGGNFPWTVEDYHNWLQDAYHEHEFDWAAVMDLACEPAFDDTMTVQERQDRTLDNTLRHLSFDPEYPVLPVLQGRTPEQWLAFHDRLQDHGVDTSYVGVGTLCRQSSTNQIVETERRLRRESSVEAMHGFGVKISAFQRGAFFESADSKAWCWPANFGDKYVQHGRYGIRRVPYEDATTAHRDSFVAYRNRAVWLQSQAGGRRTNSVQSTLQ